MDEYMHPSVSDIGLIDAIRVLKECRRATENIPRPTRKGKVDAYVDTCAPIVMGIVKQAMKDDLPE